LGILESLRRIQALLDSAFRVPGTGIRFGWDPILGLVPGLGDFVTAAFALTVLIHANRMRVPRIIQLRMALNTLVDLAIGALPFLGDVGDVFWKSNARNFALLERYATGAGRVTAGDWVFVTGIIAVVLAVAALPVILVLGLVSLLSQALMPPRVT
jgi:Domain of unknown function (DUF4112)